MTSIITFAETQPKTITITENPVTNIRFQTACGVGGIFDPSITLRAGCPFTPEWDFGDGTTATGTSVGKADYADAGPHTVTLTIPNIGYWLTGIDVSDDKITGDFLGALIGCTSLTSITTGGNTDLASNLTSLAGLTALTTLNLQEHQMLLVGDISNLAGLTNLTYIYCAGTGIYGDIASLNVLTNLTHLDIHSNTTGTGIHGDLSSIPALATNLGFLVLGNTYITGECADLASFASLGVLMVYSSGGLGTGLVSGSVTDLPDGIAYLDIGGAAIHGGVMPATAAQWLGISSASGWTQAEVDAFLAALYTNRASYTGTGYGATHYLNIAGTNAAPSGTYQDDATPTTGLEYVYKLCNDPDGEGFTKWHIIYTGGDKP